jgi:hypothetical protein
MIPHILIDTLKVSMNKLLRPATFTGVYSGSKRNEQQKQKNNISGE